MPEFNLSSLFSDLFSKGQGPEIEVDGQDSRLIAAQSDERFYSVDPASRFKRKVFLPVTLGGVFLPYVYMTISAVKNIVITPLTDRRGSVKELISVDDYRIAIRGFFIDAEGKFPEQQVSDLKTLFERNEAIDLECALSDLFFLSTENGAKDKVIITDFRLLEKQGVEHVREFELNLITDQQLELTIL